MSEEVKKISFGFSKLAKPKTSIISNSNNVKSDESVQFIDCVEDKSIKVKNEGPKKPDFLVIPLPKQNVSVNSKRSELLQKILNNTDESENKDDLLETTSVNNVSTIVDSTKVESLDEIATREIIEDLKNRKSTEDDKQDFTVPLTSEKHPGSKEATLDDYESIPVEKFGLAMLRGMGWAPGKGIGKTEQVISTKPPILRPKGLGLGADKVIKAEEKSVALNEQLKLVKGSFVRIIAGVHKDLFGEVIGFDDETSRIIVKMALGNNILTFNEFMAEVISKEDFNKNSKVINVKKYEEYKLKENSKGVVVKEIGGKQTSNDDNVSNQKVKHKPFRRSSSESSLDSSKEKKITRRQETHNQRSSSPERSRKGHSSKIKESISNYKESPGRSPDRYKYSREDTKKNRNRVSSPPEQKDSSKYRHKSKRYRSSSEEPSRASKHVARKKSKRRNSSSNESSSEVETYSKEKESKHRTRKRSSSNSSSDEDRKKKHISRSDYKKKCKKNKEKKKSRKHSRSNSRERRKSKPSKKHKKSKYYDS